MNNTNNFLLPILSHPRPPLSKLLDLCTYTFYHGVRALLILGLEECFPFFYLKVPSINCSLSPLEGLNRKGRVFLKHLPFDHLAMEENPTLSPVVDTSSPTMVERSI